MIRTKGLVKLATRVVFLALLAVLVAACGNEVTPAPQPTLTATVIPASDPTPNPTPAPEPTATAIPAPDPTPIPNAVPTTIPTPKPTPRPTIDPEDAIKAEVAATIDQFGQALSMADAELLGSLFLQSEKTSSFATSEPLRANGWSVVEGSFKGLLSLPPGSVSLVLRQENLDLLSAEAALWTGHFILNVRQPEEPRQTIEGRMTTVLQKVDGKWLRINMHTSVLPR